MSTGCGPVRREHLFQVRADGLGEDVPAVADDGRHAGEPAGAGDELRRPRGRGRRWPACCAHRLVTLTGVGGVGKTRLALQVAAEMLASSPTGLAGRAGPVGDPDAVPEAVAGVLGVTAQPGSVDRRRSTARSGRRLLLVLDNCEHLLDAAADLVETILAAHDDDQGAGDLAGGPAGRAEQLWPVPSLDTAGGTGSAAVELFVERARSVNPGFDLGDPTAIEAVIEICRRLDGIALAIELAAARMVSMSPQDVRDRLERPVPALAGSRRGLERHQTLRHAVDWSYDLLDDDEKAVLGRCSVFAGGFDLAAAPTSADGRLRRVQRCWTWWTPGPQVAGDDGAVGGRPATACWRRSASSPRSTSTGIVWQSLISRRRPRLVRLSELANWALPLDRGRTCDLVVPAAIAARAVSGRAAERFEAFGWAEELLSAT